MTYYFVGFVGRKGTEQIFGCTISNMKNGNIFLLKDYIATENKLKDVAIISLTILTAEQAKELIPDKN